MKHTPKNYAEAIHRALEANPQDRDRLVKNSAAVIAKNNDYRLFAKIANELKIILTKKNGGRHVKIEFAREPSDKERETITSLFSRKDWIESYLNPELVAGIRITLDSQKELDNSLAYKLDKIFKGGKNL